MGVLDLIKDRIVYFDGGSGTFLQENGLKVGENPENLNIENKELVIKMHTEFLNAGADIILTNTFGLNNLKFKEKTQPLAKAAIDNAKEAIKNSNKKAYIAYDIGPIGKMMEPMGDLKFDEAYKIFKEQVEFAKDGGADLILIETMSDLYEVKAAVLAAKENSNLPIFASITFDENFKTLTGADAKTMVAYLEGLGVSALGVNCSLGPKEMIPIIKDILKYSSTPVLVSPNAGLPKEIDGKTVFLISADEFSDYMLEIANLGAVFLGGCCGTKKEHIEMMIKKTKNIKPKAISKKDFTIATSYSKTVFINEEPKIIGERINPTGKKLLKEALKNNNLDYVLKEALLQEEKGADILDVNMGLPEIDENEMMQKSIKAIQSVTDIPLQIDTTDFKTMENAMRIYNGKPIVNSVNAKKEEMEKIFPLIKKYGGVIIGLTLDEKGIPNTAKERFLLAKKIVDTAKTYNIDKKDIIIDCLVMAVSTDKNSAKVILETLKLIKENLGVKTVLGVSNISFGLPYRKKINSSFYTMALTQGLNCAILNPLDDEIITAHNAFLALNAQDDNFENFISKYASIKADTIIEKSDIDLKTAIIKGLSEDAKNNTIQLLKTQKPLDIINEYLIKALDEVGKNYEEGKSFLPQLLMSASAAGAAFDEIKAFLLNKGEKQVSKGKIVLATVKGDIHDIGKNIVKVLLENYGFTVIDLGKDVDIDLIVDTVIKEDVKLVGLSALMTTTVSNMQKTIKKLNEKCPDVKIMVGGAVLNEEYAKMINANKYSKDAVESVNYALEFFKNMKD